MDAIDRQGDSPRRVAGAQKVPVHRMGHAIVAGRPVRGDDGLGQHLAPEDAARRHRVGDPGEDVLGRPGVTGGDIQDVQHFGDRIGLAAHPCSHTLSVRDPYRLIV